MSSVVEDGETEFVSQPVSFLLFVFCHCCDLLFYLDEYLIALPKAVLIAIS